LALPNASNERGNPESAIAERLRKVRAFVFDVDGTLTDGRLYYGDDGRCLRAFHVHDGLAIRWLIEFEATPIILTGKTSQTVPLRAAELGIRHVIQGSGDKLRDFDALRRELRLEWDEVAAVGDDLPDLPLMQRCACGIAPADAAPQVLQRASLVTRAPGGAGAVREAIEAWLRATGRWEGLLKRYCVMQDAVHEDEREGRTHAGGDIARNAAIEGRRG
jgi:3-deoxy-D-manno-octulosonate 8-phosphate phosphatase (KDO 8-P phosphatase)